MIIDDKGKFIRRVYESDNGPISRKFKAYKKKGTFTNGKNGKSIEMQMWVLQTSLYRTIKLKKENMEHED